MEVLLLVLLIGSGFSLYFYYENRKEYLNAKEQNLNFKEQIGRLHTLNQSISADKEYWHSEALDSHGLYEKERERNAVVVSQKMSNLVRTGAILENIVPLIPSLPYDSKNMHHLGQPLDFIYFNYDGADGPEIVFIEVKSGKAKESKRQKMLKKAIQDGKVFYELLTINDKEICTKRVNNNE